MCLIERHHQHSTPRPGVLDRRLGSKRRLARSALADEQSDLGAGVGASLAQPSTRFFSSLSAVSVMTFSALRLNNPIIGIFRSTVNS